MTARLRAVLFDLDGTLVDSAADMHAVADAMRHERGMPALPFAAFRPWVSKGGRAMLQCAFPALDLPAVDALLPQFLDRYATDIAGRSGLFDGMDEALQWIERNGLRWGVVSNKPEHLARALMDALDLSARSAVLIGGDTLPARKPDPLPLRVACERIGVEVGEAIYVGDDARDIVAARAAPMPSVAAEWGYLAAGESAAHWHADHVLAQPRALIDLLTTLLPDTPR